MTRLLGAESTLGAKSHTCVQQARIPVQCNLYPCHSASLQGHEEASWAALLHLLVCATLQRAVLDVDLQAPMMGAMKGYCLHS